MDFKYYSYSSLVIRLAEPHNYKDVVSVMRAKFNSNSFRPINMMWEDISSADVEDYIDYLNECITFRDTRISHLENYVGRLKAMLPAQDESSPF